MPLTRTNEGREAFQTHFNYIRSLKHHIADAALWHTNIIDISRAPLPLLDKKKNLIDLTRKSLNDEAKIVRSDREYSYASTSWLPIKTYYLMFNLMLTIEYLLTLDEHTFQISHGTCSMNFTKRLARREISFSKPEINIIYDRTIFLYHEDPGANLRLPITTAQHVKLAMKKIASYKLEEWKRLKRIPNFASKRHQNQREQFLERF
jgi:hypothetical protein